MRLFFWRRKPEKQAEKDEALAEAMRTTAASASVATVARSEVPTKPLAMPPVELRDALLRFARDYLLARGARVRAEEADLISAVLTDGTTVRYTTTLARARADEQTDLLVQGGSALAALVDDSSERARITSLRLATAGNPLEIARSAVVEPAEGCNCCVESYDGELPALCRLCPLREGRLVLRGMGRLIGASEVRHADIRAVELAYHVVSSDRHGRRDEWMRAAFDCGDGRAVEPLPLETVALALAADLPVEEAASLFAAAHDAATKMVELSLDASGAFLRLRSEGEFQRRLDDIRTTFERVQREGTSDPIAAETAFTREVERLHDIYAVSVEAQLESVAFIVSPAALVSLKFSSGTEMPLWVDLGRAHVVAPVCTSCGAPLRAGTLCKRGHLTCPACSSRHAGGCPVCDGVARALDGDGGSGASLDNSVAHSDALSVRHLEVMTSDIWQAFVTWLLEQEGYSVERVGLGALGSIWHGTGPDGSFVATAFRPEGKWGLGGEEVQRAAALRTEGARVVLMTTAPTAEDARDMAARLDIRLIDAEQLSELLEKLGSAHTREREEASLDREQRVSDAITAREQMLMAVRSLEAALAAAVNSRRTSGRTAVVSAVAAIVKARQRAQQAILAWDTLVDDWQAAFGEREARDGSLPIVATVDQLSEYGQRAEHLADVLRPALVDIAATPGMGELGYGAWRKAILEELTAHCEALRWRLSALDPTNALSFAAAHDAEALAQAEAALTAATHASARVEKAYAQLETRARLKD
ncbi:MAG TPA: hypothetical protein VF510_22385 [Ktedonobacterales bacterium]